MNKRSKRTDDAVMYVNLNSGATENACPSIADSSAVSLGKSYSNNNSIGNLVRVFCNFTFEPH